MSNDFANSRKLFERARQRIPGGVNSPVRAFRGVDRSPPIFFERGEGPYLYDSDGNRYIDYVASWGPLILGHSPLAVQRAITEQAALGLSFGAPTEAEVLLAERIGAAMSAMEKLRMVNSGTEATMSAIRLARGFTGRERIVKFAGCYHGHSDSLLVKAGSGALTLGLPDSPGVPAGLAQYTSTLDYNDCAGVERLFGEVGDEIAAVIVEPIAGNMGLIAPVDDFLPTLRHLCDRHGALLILDEVMTGFRVALGGAQSLYGVRPDLTTLGKVIGGGMPVGAFGGRADIMDNIAPDGPVYQAGTLSGNPLAMRAGLATLEAVAQPGFFDALGAKTQALAEGLEEAAAGVGVPLTTTAVGGMFGFFFSGAPVRNLAQAQGCDTAAFKAFFAAMLEQGVYLAPSAFEAGFVSAAHDDDTLRATLTAAGRAFASLKP